MATDIALDSDNKPIIKNGDLQLVSGSDETLQRCRNQLGFFLGEWFLDLDAGVPWRTVIFVKNPNLVAAREVFRRELRKIPDVASVTSVDITVATDRNATITFEAVDGNGASVSGQVGF